LGNYQIRKNIAILVLLAIPVLFVVQAGFCADTTKVSIAETATGEEINWQVISSGGTEGASTSYKLAGTVGQTAVGFGSSEGYGLNHGYWQDFSGGCCVIRGDVDHSGVLPIDIADLVYLVDYMFNQGPEPECFDEGDVDGSGVEPIDIADLVYLVDYMFNSGPAPPPCP